MAVIRKIVWLDVVIIYVCGNSVLLRVNIGFVGCLAPFVFVFFFLKKHLNNWILKFNCFKTILIVYNYSIITSK